MSGGYNRVYPAVWRDRTLAAMSIADRYVFLYLLTCKERTSEGIFELHAGAAAAQCGLDEPSFREALENLHTEGVALWDEPNRVVLLPAALKYQNSRRNEKNAKGIMARVRYLGATPLLVPFWRAAVEHDPTLAVMVKGWLSEQQIDPSGPEIPPISAPEIQNGFGSDPNRNRISDPDIPTAKAIATTTTTDPLRKSPTETQTGTDTDAQQAAPRFEDFWQQWPNKRDKQPAHKAWRKLAPADQQLAADRIGDYVTDCQNESRSLQYGATYLNARTWENYEPGWESELAPAAATGDVRALSARGRVGLEASTQAAGEAIADLDTYRTERATPHTVTDEQAAERRARIAALPKLPERKDLT